MLPETLKKRRDFLACSRARKQSAPGLMLQARRRAAASASPAGTPSEGEPPETARETASGAVRIGYTCSRKIGNAVTRNRAKRRLRAAARAVLAREGRPGWDYVLVGRPGATVSRDFAALVEDLRDALARIHAPRPNAPCPNARANARPRKPAPDGATA
ncbi:MAG: ribonuclease P protein component, partial [Pseudomonadota bacterium]